MSYHQSLAELLAPHTNRMAHREAHKGGKGTGLGPSNNAPRIPAATDKSPEALTKLAYKLSLETGVSIDTRFFAYSRRKPDGTVFAPRAVYANSWILRTKLSSYFEPLLRGGYKTTFDVLDSQFPTEFKSETDEYDYGSDSDIDGDEEGDEGTLKSLSAYVPKTPAAKKADDALKDKTKQIHTLGRGQTVLMGNFAFSTWKAFIFYLCVGEVNFSQLKSQASASATPAAATRKNLSPVAPPCSPKSMYRLADELGFDELKKKAMDDIKSKLTADNILAELFSTITSRYEAIQDLEIDYACTTARTVVSTKIISYVSGMGPEDQARNAEVMSRFIARLTRNTPSAERFQPTSGSVCSSCGQSNPLCANCRHSSFMGYGLPKVY